VPRLQRKVLELERAVSTNASYHAHRSSINSGTVSNGNSNEGDGNRRMIPRPPAVHDLRGHSAVVTSVEVHPLYTIAVSGSEDGTIKVWDHESGEYFRTLKGHTNSIHGLSFTPTGSHLASASSDLSVKIWDFNTYTCVRTLRGHDHTISSVLFLPGPLSLFASGLSSAGNDTSEGSSAGEPTSSGTGIDSSLTGSQFLVSASRDTTVKFWDVETGFCDATISDHTDWVRCLAVRPESNSTLASSTTSSTTAANEEAVATSTTTASLLATAGNDRAIMVYDAESRKKICELRGHDHVVETLAFLTCAPPSKSSKDSGTKITSEERRRKDEIRDYLASGSRDRTVKLWSVKAASCLMSFEAHENWVRGVLIHPNGRFIISCGDDRSIRVFDIKANRCLRTIDAAHAHFVSSIAMHHTLPVLVSGSVDTTVKCWQLD